MMAEQKKALEACNRYGM